MVAEKFFPSNAKHSFAKDKVISKCKNDKPWKNQIGKMPAPSPPLLRKPTPAPNFHPLFWGGKGGEVGGGPNYVVWMSQVFHQQFLKLFKTGSYFETNWH